MPPHFFISYRRSDHEGQYLAHWIFRELDRRYGEGCAFLDVDSRSPGLSFPAKVDRALRITDVVLVIIGPLWLQRLAEKLEDSRDWVRYEVAESLKRESLPVVPVCRAGVEMPQPHELPEDLRDLGWRDGVTLDPFRSFLTDLDRLLSDLEKMLAASLRAKEELRVARAKLIALLQWRARELELTAAREAAAARAAEEARKRAEAKAEAGRRATEAKRAAKEAAQAKAVEQKRATPKVSETIPAIRSTKDATAVSTAPTYYQLSNHYTLTGVISSVLISSLVIFALAFAYSSILLNLPFVQSNFLWTFLYGVFSSATTGFIVRLSKVRNERVAILIGLTSGFIAVYLSWAIWLYGHQGLFEMNGFAGLLRFVASPAALWHDLYRLNGTGSWDIWGYKPTGIVLWIIWIFEALLITGLSSLSVLFIIVDVFCEGCDACCDRYFSTTLRYCDPEEFKRRIQAKDFSYLASLGPPPKEASQWLKLFLCQCGKCGTTNTLDASSITAATDAQGKPTTISKTLVGHLLLSTSECKLIHNLGRRA